MSDADWDKAVCAFWKRFNQAAYDPIFPPTKPLIEGEVPTRSVREEMYPHTAQVHPHATCPYCTNEVGSQELVQWMVDNDWRTSKQEVVALFLRKYKVIPR